MYKIRSCNWFCRLLSLCGEENGIWNRDCIFNLDKKQTSFKIPPPPSFAELLGFDVNETGQVSAKGESENGVTSDDYTLECRARVFTGSRFKYRICAPIAEWATVDRKNRGKTDQLFRDLDDVDVNTLSPDPRESTAGQMPR